MSITNKQSKYKVLYDVDRNEFSFWQFLFLYKQSEYHVKVYNLLLFGLGITFLIMFGENFNFTNIDGIPLVIFLDFFAFITIKLERWLMSYWIDENLLKISKNMDLFGHRFKLFENDLGDIDGLYKLEYEMVYYLTFKKSNKKVFFSYTKSNPRVDIVKYFTEELHLELKEVKNKN